MSEIRYDPHRGEWTLIAPGRRARPRPAHHGDATPKDEDPACPFCPGNESATPPEVAALRDADSLPNAPGWRARCVPNKYPAVGSTAPQPAGGDVFVSLAGGGRHEVLIDSAHHTRGLADLSDAHAGEVLGLLQERARAMARDAHIRFVCAFKNHGARAGASLLHSHFQILGLPVAPGVVTRKGENERTFFSERKVALLDHTTGEEIKAGARLVEAGEEGAVVFCPWGSRLPWLVQISPWPTEAAFTQTSTDALAAVGGALARTLRRYKRLLADPPVNVSFLMAAREEEARAHRWHLEVFPRLTPLAGLETGLGTYVNEVPPERAAEELRGADAAFAPQEENTR